MALKIDTETIDDWLRCIAVSGELDAYTAPSLLAAMTEALDAGLAWLVVDLRQTEYIDSVGLGILIGGVKRAGAREGDLAVACSRPNIRRVFEVSGTVDLLNVRDELTAAVSTLAAERAARGGCAAAGEEATSDG
jgi:anti-sigma B factor antagonist